MICKRNPLEDYVIRGKLVSDPKFCIYKATRKNDPENKLYVVMKYISSSLSSSNERIRIMRMSRPVNHPDPILYIRCIHITPKNEAYLIYSVPNELKKTKIISLYEYLRIISSSSANKNHRKNQVWKIFIRLVCKLSQLHSGNIFLGPHSLKSPKLIFLYVTDNNICLTPIHDINFLFSTTTSSSTNDNSSNPNANTKKLEDMHLLCSHFSSLERLVMKNDPFFRYVLSKCIHQQQQKPIVSDRRRKVNGNKITRGRRRRKSELSSDQVLSLFVVQQKSKELGIIDRRVKSAIEKQEMVKVTEDDRMENKNKNQPRNRRIRNIDMINSRKRSFSSSVIIVSSSSRETKTKGDRKSNNNKNKNNMITRIRRRNEMARARDGRGRSRRYSVRNYNRVVLKTRRRFQQQRNNSKIGIEEELKSIGKLCRYVPYGALKLVKFCSGLRYRIQQQRRHPKPNKKIATPGGYNNNSNLKKYRVGNKNRQIRRHHHQQQQQQRMKKDQVVDYHSYINNNNNNLSKKKNKQREEPNLVVVGTVKKEDCKNRKKEKTGKNTMVRDLERRLRESETKRKETESMKLIELFRKERECRERELKYRKRILELEEEKKDQRQQQQKEKKVSPPQLSVSPPQSKKKKKKATSFKSSGRRRRDKKIKAPPPVPSKSGRGKKKKKAPPPSHIVGQDNRDGHDLPKKPPPCPPPRITLFLSKRRSEEKRWKRRRSAVRDMNVSEDLHKKKESLMELIRKRMDLRRGFVLGDDDSCSEDHNKNEEDEWSDDVDDVKGFYD